MRIAVDTSVIVAGLLARHERHAESHRELDRLAGSQTAPCLPLHALLESYAVLTRLPAPHRLAPRDAQQLLYGSFAAWEVAGTPQDAWRFLEEETVAAVAGGTIYDAVIVASAVRAGAEELVTWNVTHFERLARRRMSIRSPGDGRGDA